VSDPVYRTFKEGVVLPLGVPPDAPADHALDQWRESFPRWATDSVSPWTVPASAYFYAGFMASLRAESRLTDSKTGQNCCRNATLADNILQSGDYA
jgi:hypothetical protein